MARFKALIVGGDPATREGLRTTLATPPGDYFVEVVGEGASVRAAVQVARELLPDVVYMDARQPGIDAFEATRRLLRASPDTGVILITNDRSDRGMIEAIDAGISGIGLDVSVRTLVTLAIKAAGNQRPEQLPIDPPADDSSLGSDDFDNN